MRQVWIFVRRLAVEATAVFVVALALTALGAPRAADARPAGKNLRIGVLNAERFPPGADPRLPFFLKLRELGWVDGRNVVIKEVYADGDLRRLPALVAELIRLKVDLIVARGTPATRAAKNATDTVPVVMATMGNPHPIVASFAHPGRQFDGVTTFSTELTGKRIELLKELVPRLSPVVVLHHMGNPTVPPEGEETKTAAPVASSIMEREDPDHATRTRGQSWRGINWPQARPPSSTTWS